jgi:hypothetical protein
MVVYMSTYIWQWRSEACIRPLLFSKLKHRYSHSLTITPTHPLKHSSPGKLAPVVKLLACIQEASLSNLSRDTDYPEVFRCYLQTVLENVGVVPSNRIQPRPSKFFNIQYSLIILLFHVIYSETLTASSEKPYSNK